MLLNKNVRVKILAGLVAVMGVVNVISSVFFADSHRVEFLKHILTPEISMGSRSVTLVAGFLLIGIAWRLAQRRQMALLVTTWLLAFSILTNVLKGLDIEEALVAFFILVALSFFRRDFNVRSDINAISNIFFAAPYALLFFFAYGVIGFYLLRHHFQQEFQLSAVLQEFINLSTFQGERYYLPLSREARWFLESVTMMSGVSFMYLFYTIMQPVLNAAPVNRRDRTAAEAIVKTSGASSIAFFTLGNDKSYYFNEDATSIVPYVLNRNTALAAGDPVGPPEEIDRAIKGFHSLCDENGWIPAFYYVYEQHKAGYEKAGFKVLKIGEEAVIDIQAFETKGKSRQDLRSAINKANRDGWKFNLFEGSVDDPEITKQIEEISEEWLAGKTGGEMGFTMGGTSPTGAPGCLVTTATDGTGKVIGFMTWTPMYSAQGWSADYMRRSNDSPHGTMEYLITSTILALKEKGCKLLSLGMAPLANVHEENPEAIVSIERGIELIYEKFDTAYNFKSLHHFKQKFDPRWENRYLVYPNVTVLPRVIFSLVSVQVPELSIGEIVKVLNQPPKPKPAAKPEQKAEQKAEQKPEKNTESIPDTKIKTEESKPQSS